MKTNRQNKPIFPNAKNRKANTFVPAHLNKKKNYQQFQRQTLAFLLSNHLSDDTVSLICRDQLIVSFESKHQVQLNHRLPSHTNSNQRSTIYSIPNQSSLLKNFLQEYQLHPHKKFVFSVKNYSHKVNQFRVSQGDTKGSFLCKTSSERDLNPFLGLPKQPMPKTESKMQSDANIHPVANGQFKHCLSQIIKGSNLKKNEMFTVEQLKQSIQSQIKESFKSHQDKENIKDTNRLQNNLWQNRSRGRKDLHMPGLISFAQEDKESQEQLANTQLLPTSSTEPKYKTSFQSQKEKQASEVPVIPTQFCQQESGLSITTNLRKGIIQGHASASQQLSFKIAGDQSIQYDKRRNDESEAQQMSHIEQISSIVSNAREDIFKRETEQQQVDSIRCDIEDLSRCFAKNANQSEVELIQKVDLKKLAHEREQGLDSDIEISQKVVNPISNVSEVMVKYNVRFLPKKNEQTEIVRLSPLRFRRKEEVVHALLKAKIVPKQSDSITVM